MSVCKHAIGIDDLCHECNEELMITDFLKKHRMTQAELSRHIGVAPTTLQCWRQTKPRHPQLTAMALETLEYRLARKESAK
jgi:DNA-binding XRE family transcriptional regulator